MSVSGTVGALCAGVGSVRMPDHVIGHLFATLKFGVSVIETWTLLVLVWESSEMVASALSNSPFGCVVGLLLSLSAPLSEVCNAAPSLLCARVAGSAMLLQRLTISVHCNTRCKIFFISVNR